MAEATLGRRRTAETASIRVEAREWVIAHLDVVAFGALIAVAAALRFWDLGARALHHDESLHATFSWYFYSGSVYRHDPLMHGPFQFMINAANFFLFGPSDYTARLPHALFGTALVGLPFLLRKQIGIKAAFIAAVFFCFSPTLLYYSRFDREDAYDMFFTTAMVVCLWRFLDEHKMAWLYGLAGVTAFSFATKETTFIEVAIILVFIDLLLAIELGKPKEGEEADTATVFFRTLGLVPFAWAIAALWPLLGAKPFGRDKLPAAGDVMVVLGTLSLPQFAAAVQAMPLLKNMHFFSNKGYFALSTVTGPTPEDTMRMVTVATLIIVSMYVGMVLWKPKQWAIAAACFYIPYILLFTTFFMNQPMPWRDAFWQGHGGFFSGIWGSLDYWLDQQNVRRGSQPTYYYAIVTPLYEFLPLVLALAGAAWMAIKGDAFKRWLLFWFVGIFIGLTMAGEKMPWLEVYIAIPLALIAAVVLARAVENLKFSLERWQELAGIAVASVAGTLLLVSFDSAALNYAGGALLALAAGGAVYLLASEGVLAGARAGLVIAVSMLLFLSARAGTMAAYQHGDIPVEMLVYTQTSPDIPKLMDRIDALAKESKLGYNLPIVVDATDGFSWPWAWYLRDYHDVGYPTITAGYVPPPNAVLLIAKSNASMVDATGYNTMPYKHRWWFIEESYRDLTPAKVWDRYTNPLLHAGITIPKPDLGKFEELAGFWLNRRSDTFTGSVDAVAYFPASLASFDVRQAPAKPAPPPSKADDGRIVIGKLGTGQGEFNAPSDAFVDSQGNVWVADTNNNRIEKFDRDGQFVGMFGGGGSGTGRFNQPWSLTVDSDGFIYVADTWNHRIEKFDKDFKFVSVWGVAYFGDNPGPLQMFGPRDIVLGPDGTLWVSDTGNKRLINYTKNGDFIRSVGQGGTGSGQLNEGVGLAFDATGGLLVADTWNARIERFGADFQSATSFPAGWTSKDAIHKPYLAVLSDGRIVASEPAKGYLMLFDRTGTPLGTWKPADNARPIGVAATADGGFVFTDAARNEAQVVPVDLIGKLFK